MGDQDEKKSDCVKVAVRLRPPSQKEMGNNEKCIIEIEANTGDGTGSVTINDPEGKEKPAEFAFDIVFGLDTQQINVFESVGRAALDSTLTGYNGTIFAYGQTGSGKSWCMSGGPGDLRGIIPRVNENLFDKIVQMQEEINTRRFLVMCSFFEIYNEIIFDLLNPVQDRSKLGAGLQVKEHPVLGIYVKDLQEIVVSDADKLEKIMANGTKNRAVSSTMMNSVSSRSHSIFIIKVHQKDDEDKSKNVFAKLNLVDLAGSERQKGTGATGQTLKEGANINKSLSALGNVINALVENANGKKVFVPFRNSKLTRVLQESLGGNSLTTMLATLSPAACNYEETLSTLRYANRAKAIKVSATKNEEASQISRLNAEVEELKKKLATAGPGGGGGGGSGIMAEEERQEIRQKFEQQLKDMEQMLSSTWEEKASLSKNHEEQLAKAIEEQRQQAKAMEEECRKRFRLLQDQEDLALSIRALADTVQSLPAKAESTDATSPSLALRSGAQPRQWLKNAGAINEVVSALKGQQQMAVVFQGAFKEDLRLWVDGEETSDHAMIRAGSRRALNKLETLRRECGRLCALEQQGQSQAEEFASQVAEASAAWASTGAADALRELREAAGRDDHSGEDSAESKPETQAEEFLIPPMYTQAIEDIGRITKLIEQQARAKANEFSSLAVLEVHSMAELALKGMSLSPGGNADNADMDLIRSMAAPPPPQAPAQPTEHAGSTAPARPKEERPLHEWTEEDADGAVESTQFALTQLVQLDTLNKKKTPQELLTRPPPKFVHDVARLVAEATGFLSGLSEEWPDPREAKIDLLQQIADSVISALGLASVDFDPADVLKGKEVPQTLRLLQLMAIAAARSQHCQPSEAGSKAHPDHSKEEGLAPASEVPRLLDALVRCIGKAAQQQQEQANGRPCSGRASPTRELENSYHVLQERLEDETQVRKRQEERLAALQAELETSRSVLCERNVQLDDLQQAASNVESRKIGLRQQVDGLRLGLLEKAKQLKSQQVIDLKEQLEEVAKTLNTKNQLKLKLTGEVKRLQQQQIETDSERETIELEVKRMKLRLAEGLVDGGAVRNQTDEIIELQAEKQKLDVKVLALEENMRNLTEADDFERQRENGLLEEMRVQSHKSDDFQMQLQVIVEERDALREGMDKLWQDKARTLEELENVTDGYTALSDRLLEKSMEARELEEDLQKYENLLSMLQENFEKNRHSPAPVATHCNGPPAVNGTGAQTTNGTHVPGLAPGPAPGPAADADEKGSSHYSDDDFEEPDED
mmetsp:Transcript_42847/g.118436  ORF Transcript_42847/g.118436 Transcript_42847/m.118436 type:complete len:1278 (+) Transcript_42847:79-3912(+)|eukprot:CAMPEP_0117526816 /NCGR_PEP_ID=MMETSP0784-20121206/36479_1 /TAXON_ID=39447 /ORGANISM="" /LENGTH=1277 /DNA_ID=CAMNT_0005323053 /DNA_START=1 /DNA_END=3834 /DNA_ORIENTATION=+